MIFLEKKIIIEKRIFPSIVQASRELGHSRKLIRERIKSINFPEWKEIVDS